MIWRAGAAPDGNYIMSTSPAKRLEMNIGKHDPASLEQNIAARFGCVPNFFRLAAADPRVSAHLWDFAQFAYLDNPLPSLFKERLFVYLSRVCQVRYCTARHVGFLIGLGSPAGDLNCAPQTAEAVLPLLKLPLARGEIFAALLRICRELDSPIRVFPPPDSAAERALFACAAHVFLQTPDAPPASAALHAVFDPPSLEHLHLFLSFVRIAHDWTRLHPEITFEDDVFALLKTHPGVADAILHDPESAGSLPPRDTTVRDLVSAIPAAVYACDSEGRLIYHNHKATDLWDREPQSDDPPWAFLEWRKLLQADGTPFRPEEEPIRGVMASGSPVINQELALERPGAPRIDVLVNMAPLRDSAGCVQGTVCIVQDISCIKRAQQERERLVDELKRSNHELSRFSYALAHDLNAPVRSVRALTQLLIRRTDTTSPDAAHLAGLIEKAALGMEQLVDSLLKYAHAGQGEIRRELVSTQATLDAVRVSLADLIEQGGARISYSGLPAVEADPVLLHQLFQNLIANAIKYHRPGHAPVIVIEGEQSEEGWQFSVADNGQGIPPERQREIFEPLKRLHGSEIPGSGLGLALCRTIVARHGGRIWVESGGQGSGAAFCFTLAHPAPKS